MNTKPFPARLTEASWATEWPLLPQFGAGSAPPQESVPASMGWAWHAATSVRSALDGTGNPVPLDLAHRFLDELEGWTVRHRALLTWPATPLSFARALSASARQNDAAVVSVLVAYPAYCRQVLDQARLIDSTIPEMDALFTAPGFSAEVKPVAKPPQGPASASPPTASSITPKAPLDRAARPRIEVPAQPPAFLVRWADAVEAEKEPALAKHYLDQQIKTSVSSFDGPPWQWFSRALLPGLAALPVEKLQALVDAWPHHNRFSPPNPVQVVDSAPFWIVMREAGGARREILFNGGLASMLDMDDVSAQTKLEMATKMFPFVAKKASAFRQRLQLWASLGGDLDESVPPGSIEGVDATSVRDWISKQSNEEWDTVVEGFKPSPSESRFNRRGPG